MVVPFLPMPGLLLQGHVYSEHRRERRVEHLHQAGEERREGRSVIAHFTPFSPACLFSAASKPTIWPT